ncbi:MAG: hypothetical protein HON70_28375 [Lentisphaerae bacterium]|nr:hypothetical protein [Lentisphaerota bacterium]
MRLTFAAAVMLPLHAVLGQDISLFDEEPALPEANWVESLAELQEHLRVNAEECYTEEVIARKLEIEWPLPETKVSRDDLVALVDRETERIAAEQMEALDADALRIEAREKFPVWQKGQLVSFVDRRGRKIEGRITYLAPNRIRVGTTWISSIDFTDGIRSRLDESRAKKAQDKYVSVALRKHRNEQDFHTADARVSVQAGAMQTNDFILFRDKWYSDDEIREMLARFRNRLVQRSTLKGLAKRGYCYFAGSWVPEKMAFPGVWKVVSAGKLRQHMTHFFVLAGTLVGCDGSGNPVLGKLNSFAFVSNTGKAEGDRLSFDVRMFRGKETSVGNPLTDCGLTGQFVNGYTRFIFEDLFSEKGPDAKQSFSKVEGVSPKPAKRYVCDIALLRSKPSGSEGNIVEQLRPLASFRTVGQISESVYTALYRDRNGRKRIGFLHDPGLASLGQFGEDDFGVSRRLVTSTRTEARSRWDLIQKAKGKAKEETREAQTASVDQGDQDASGWRSWSEGSMQIQVGPPGSGQHLLNQPSFRTDAGAFNKMPIPNF